MKMKMKMNCVSMMAVLIMSVLLCSSNLNVADGHGTKESGFCTRSASSNTCPNPPTIDTLNLTAYLGRWYEIGSTASFKLLSEAGLRCNQAVYSSSDGGSVRLVNSGQKVLSDGAILEIGAINVAARGICAAARQACADVAQSGNATWRLSRVAAAASAALSELSGDISRIQRLAGKINEGGYGPDARSDGLRWSVAALKRAARSAARRLVALDLFAAALVKEGSVNQKAVGVRIGAASASASAGLAAVRAAASGLLSSGQPNYTGPVTFVNGTITQPDPATSAGKLRVSISVVSAPYWIIDLIDDSGTPSHPSYSAALVFSCSQFAGTVSKSLFVLSRRPYLDRATSSRFLAKARSLGIYNDCNDPFLFTLQQGGLCGRVV